MIAIKSFAFANSNILGLLASLTLPEGVEVAAMDNDLIFHVDRISGISDSSR